MTNQRMKWDAKAAFKSLNAQGKRRQASIDDERLKTTPYTPPPNVAAWLQAQADKPKGRDYDAILRAAKKAPVGYYEDAPRGIRFGGQPLPSAGHGKDVDTADGPWPKCLSSNDGAGVIVYTGERDEGTFYGERAQKWKFRKRYAVALAEQPLWSLKQRFALPLADAIAKLEQNGHADAAAQLRGKAINSLSIPTKLIGEEFEPERTIPVVGDRFNYGDEVCTVTRIDHTREFAVRFLRCEASHEDGLKISYFTDKNPLRILKRPTPPRADVATGGGRVWRDKYMTSRINFGGVAYGHSLNNRPTIWRLDCSEELNEQCATDYGYVELFGHERDAILAECRKAMPCPQKPAS